MRRWLRTVLSVAVATTLLAACSGDGGGSQTVTPEAFVADLCTGMSTYIEDVQALAADFGGSFDPTADGVTQRDAVAGYLDDVIAVTEDLVASMEAAGVPDVEGGEAAAERLLAAFEDAQAALEDARAQVDTLPTDDTQALGEGVQALGADIEASFSAIGDSVSGLSVPELDAALRSEPACRSLGLGA